ncbi:hypothetical protein HRbin12_01155 [bacterium HR12]|nr:hypothetical protein HRbin12_01155 [bacterium HR12]
MATRALRPPPTASRSGDEVHSNPFHRKATARSVPSSGSPAYPTAHTSSVVIASTPRNAPSGTSGEEGRSVQEPPSHCAAIGIAPVPLEARPTAQAASGESASTASKRLATEPAFGVITRSHSAPFQTMARVVLGSTGSPEPPTAQARSGATTATSARSAPPSSGVGLGTRSHDGSQDPMGLGPAAVGEGLAPVAPSPLGRRDTTMRPRIAVVAAATTAFTSAR